MIKDDALSELNKFYSCIEETDEEIIAGIDEAGRGPVIGPMVYGLYVGREYDVTSYRDSKILRPESRVRFFNSMRRYAYFQIDPIYITSHMEAGSMTLNEIAKEAVVALLSELVKKCKNIKTVYIDGLGNNEEYKKTLRKYFDLNYVIENKADSKYQVVSGASIVAKVVRDSCVEGLNCGSGYPSDPRTKDWLKRNNRGFLLGFPEYVRHSWATVKIFFPSKKARKLQKSLNGFFASKG